MDKPRIKIIAGYMGNMGQPIGVYAVGDDGSTTLIQAYPTIFGANTAAVNLEARGTHRIVQQLNWRFDA